MRKLFLYTLLIFITPNIKAQWLVDYGFKFGASNYLGDIGGKDKTRRDFVADMKLSKTRWNTGVFYRRQLRSRDVFIKTSLDYLRIEGDDKLSTNLGRVLRNFNFRNDIFDLSLTGEWVFKEIKDIGNTYRFRNSFRAYLFAGIGVLYSDPKSYYQGKWVSMRHYKSEGYMYSPVVASIPFGFGFYFTFEKRHRFGFEMNFRKTFTDYLDDISSKYVSKAPKDPYAQGLILRTGELDSEFLKENSIAALSHNWGEKRGDNTHKDAFMTINFSYSRVIKGRLSFYNKRYGFLGGRKMKKIRTKF